MCLPLAAAGAAAGAANTAFAVQTALFAASTLATFVQQSQLVGAQQDAQEQNQRLTNELATEDAIRGYNQNNIRLSQERRAGAQEIQAIVHRARKAAGTAITASAKGGVAGEAIRGLLVDYERKATTFRTGVQANLEAKEQQLGAAQAGLRGTLRSRQLSAVPDVIQKPHFLNAALRLGAGTAGFYYDNTYLDDSGVRHYGVPER
jgi:hypothetical protein